MPPTAVIEELCSLSTHENAVFSAAILARLGVRRAAVVTCPWHMARALAGFRAAGVDVIALPTGFVERGAARRLYLEAHELVCSALDARALRRAEVLAESAARHASGLALPRPRTLTTTMEVEA